ncbi:phosphatase PAP2 family protein [Aegicerativicinus sediminis]|uniref:phosphatase PAP2 family protein n=1 Tax=Aegicerativicinus sediminis TaxID=2893202 RepID=UPI001E51888D|nr:phosphatase PAP2 family protein [Aegicerativicinus sediminis]
MIEKLLEFDTELFIYLNNLGSTNWDAFWMAYTSKFNWIPLYAILLYLLYKQLGLKPLLVTIVVVAAMVLFTDQITNLFKHGLQRPRPCQLDELADKIRLVKSSCGGRYGYFSGHASNSMALAVFIGFMLRYRFKYLKWILIVWAFLMAYSRVYIGVHYPLDILSGMIFGAMCGYGFYKLNLYLIKKFVSVG